MIDTKYVAYLKARIRECDEAIRGALNGGMRINRRDMAQRKRRLEAELEKITKEATV